MGIAAYLTSLSPIKKIIFLLFALMSLYMGVQLIHYHYFLVTFPYPQEYFEGAMLLSTDMLLKGQNPYALANMPVALNPYGIIYHLLVYPFAKVWGSTLLIHRAVSGVFLLFSCILFFIVLRRHRVSVIHSVSAALLLYASLLYRYTAIAKPDGPGLFFFLLSIFIVYLMNYSIASLLISVFLGVLAFYTKPYFVLSLPFIATYLFLFVSKKKAVLYGFSALILLVITALMVNHIFETYFVNTFFNHVNDATHNLDHLWLQLEFFSMYYSGVIAILVVYSLLSILDQIQSHALHAWTLPRIKQGFIQHINFYHYDKPLIEAVVPLSLYGFFFFFSIFFFWLGGHVGNMMTYAYHLVSPFFLLYTFSLLNKPLQKEHLLKRRDSYDHILLLPCILISLYFLYSSATYLWNSPEWTDVEDWKRVEQITLSYKNIMNSDVLASSLLAQNKPIYDTGDADYLQLSHYSFPWLEGLLLANADISRQWTNYENSIDTKINHEEFDAVIISTREYSRHSSYLSGLQEHYVLVNKIGVCMFQTAQCALLEIWEPNSSHPGDE